MLKNYFKIAWRTIIRHKGYAFINISGLSVGMAACLLIFVVVKYELSFETFRPNHKDIYHVVTRETWEDGVAYNPGVPAPTPDALRLYFPQAKIAAINKAYGSLISIPSQHSGGLAAEKKFTENQGIVFMEPQFFDIFQTHWLAGSPSVLAQPNRVVLDKSTADKYFGDWKNAMGRSLKMDNLLNLQVAGIIEDAKPNTDLAFKVMVSFINLKRHASSYNYNYDWKSVNSDHYVFMGLPARESMDKMNAQLKIFSEKNIVDPGKARKIEFLQPLAAMHFDTRMGYPLGDHMTDKSTIRTLSLVAILIVIMASINFINLSTAQSVSRSKEVGIRKVLGSSRGLLVGQVMGETAIIVAGALILAVTLAKLLLPALKKLASIPDAVPLVDTGSILFLGIVIILVILLSGIYPAMIVSGFKPVLALKNKITAASIGGVPLRRVLIVTQFGISQLLIISTLIALKQMNFVNDADLGFDKEAILVIPGYTDSVSLQKMESFKARLLQNPDVRAVSFMSDVPSSDNNRGSRFYFDHSYKENTHLTFLKLADADYIQTFGLHLLAGRNYMPGDTAKEVVVNETFLKKLGIRDPAAAIGKTVQLGKNPLWLPIVGVVKDFRTNSLREDIKALVIAPRKTFESTVAIKIAPPHLSKTVAAIQSLWENTYPDYDYNGFFFEDSIALFYKQENQLALVYKIFSFIAIFLSCLGLYGLVSFMVVQRTREIGVRKVLGASVHSIVYLLSKEFMILIGLSFMIALPVAWYSMASWLQNFVYRTTISGWVFGLAIALTLLLAWLTIGFKAVRAALADPVKSLRNE